MDNLPSLPPHLRGKQKQSEFCGAIPTWSYSRLSTFLKCPYSILLQSRGQKQSTHPAALRGIQIHELAENFIKGEITKLPKELKKFETYFEKLAELYPTGTVTPEEKWAFDIDWNPCSWDSPDLWGRGIVDCFVKEDETSAILTDFKTGKSRYNEVSHARQIIYYSLAGMFRFPEIEYLTTQLLYLDEGKTVEKNFTRQQVMQFLPEYTKRAVGMTTCTLFKPKPSYDACRFCSFKEETCDYGIK